MLQRLFALSIALATFTGLGCGGGNDGTTPIHGELPDGNPPARVDAGTQEQIDAGPQGTYRTSLSVCWNDPGCPRALAIGHGGLWNTSDKPYDSDAALEAAYDLGADGVKIDVRVTADNVPIIAHSSPIELFESFDCYDQKIEEMTAAEVTACHRAPSNSETFQRLDDVLGYLRGKMVAQLTVKRSEDYARTIEEVLALGAEDFAFIEISLSDLQTQIPTIAGSDSVYYVINLQSRVDEIDPLIATNNPRAIMAEFDPDIELGDLVATKLHPAGIRTFTYEDAKLASEGDFQSLFETGYDVVSANDAAVVSARIKVNQDRGVTPP